MSRKKRLILSDKAEADLEAIADYIAVDNLERALSFTHELREHCRLIPDFPLAAPLASEFGDGIRKAVFGEYLILYSVEDTLVIVHGFHHSAR